MLQKNSHRKARPLWYNIVVQMISLPLERRSQSYAGEERWNSQMMSMEERKRRAEERVAAERVRPIALEDGSYVVASCSAPGQGYRLHVDPENGAITCPCPAGAWELPCKHAEAVRLLRRRQAFPESLSA